MNPNPNTARPMARVLVVDDEENIRRLIRATLTRLSNFQVQVETAANAEEARRHLHQNRFHVVISDYRMPGETGVDLLEHVYRTSPRTARMLITAFGEIDIGVEAVNRGRVDGFLRKPWESANFMALVESFLGPRAGGGSNVGPATRSVSDAPRAPAPPVSSQATQQETAAPARSRVEIEKELAQVDRALRQLRVRLGLGGISPEGYHRANEQLNRKKAQLEMQLMRL